jgi:hypothetical protein
MMRFAIALTALALTAAPAMAQTVPLNPAQAIEAAAKSGEVEGVFEFQVGSTGASGFDVYLNSDADYRAATNLSVELHTVAINALMKQLSAHPEDVMKGKRIRVKGTARRVPIPQDNPRYFQTRIDVDSIDQIQILD